MTLKNRSKSIFISMLIVTAIFFLNGCASDAGSKKEVDESDWFKVEEGIKEIDKKVTVNGATVEIDKIKERKDGVEIWWKATSQMTNDIAPSPGASFAMGFDPSPFIEITSQKGAGMMVFDRFDQLHLADLDEVKHTPLGKRTYSGYTFFADIGIVDVKKIVVEDIIFDLPVEVEFNVNLPANFEGSLPLNLTSEIRDGKVILRNVKVGPKDTRISFKTESDPDAKLQLVDLTGVTVFGQKYYDLKKALGDEFQFVPLGEERDYTIKIWKASYRLSGPWEWEIEK